MVFEVNFDNVPDEITDFAFDQFKDVLSQRGQEYIGESLAGGDAEMDYDSQVFTLHSTVLTRVLQDLMDEKIRDMRREVRQGERDDYTLEELDQVVDQVSAAFE
jgi:hypothetical protein